MQEMALGLLEGLMQRPEPERLSQIAGNSRQRRVGVGANVVFGLFGAVAQACAEVDRHQDFICGQFDRKVGT